MNGQAAGLRARMSAVAGDRSADAAPAPAPVRLARTVAVGSGKGGVGKSTLALALAWAAAERGVRTALIDADLGLANQDILCGVQPVRTLTDWLGGRALLAECFVRLAPRLWLLPGASGVARMADLAPPQRQRLVRGLERVAEHVDLMVVDLGAGLGAGTLDVATAADHLLMVCTAEPTSLSDAYGFIKACARHGRAEHVLLTLNMVRDRAHAEQAAARLRSTCKRFLSVDPVLAGLVPADESVAGAVLARVPLLQHAPRGMAAQALRRLEGTVSGYAGVADRMPAHAPVMDAATAAVGTASGSAGDGVGFFVRLARALGLAGRGAEVVPQGVTPPAMVVRAGGGPKSPRIASVQ